MTPQEKIQKTQEISKMILKLKLQPKTVSTRKTIQKLQQEIDKIIMS